MDSGLAEVGIVIGAVLAIVVGLYLIGMALHSIFRRRNY